MPYPYDKTDLLKTKCSTWCASENTLFSCAKI